MNPSHKLKSQRVSVFFGLLIVGMGTLLCLTATPAWAQSSSTGTVSGQVTDPQGAAIPDAEVTLLDVATNNPRTASTNAAGRYSFVNIPPGTYDLSITKVGFSLARVGGQKVTVGLVLTVNVTLNVGSISQTVEVKATAGAELQTTNATVGMSISGDALMLLPNLGRDASTLVTLQPAVTPNGSVSGAVRDQNTFQLDGGNNSNDMDGTMNTYTPSYASNGGPTGVLPTPVESIEEFRVATNNHTADFNGSAGGQVQMVTKRGTNQWHGSAYEHYFGSNFGANRWLNNHTPSGKLPYTPLPSTHRNYFGGSIGGPMTPRFWGGKTYFFFNYEGFRYPLNTTVEKQVPSALLRAGVIQVQNASGTYVPYNINPNPVTVNASPISRQAAARTATCPAIPVGSG